MLAITVLMAFYWMTEALPLAVTSLLPLVLFPVTGIMKTSEIAPFYSHHLVFLFLGGFLIADAIQEWNLHKYFAFYALKLLGGQPRKVLFGFMVTTGFLSMWISNTATAIMILPIALSVLGQYQDKDDSEYKKNKFSVILLLGIAYSASLGGIATLIGTPPNVVFSGVYSTFFPDRSPITFYVWMRYALPLSLLLFLFSWFYLSYIILKTDDLPENLDTEYIQEQIRQLGKLQSPQKRVLVIFFLTALLWIFRSDVQLGIVTIPGWPRVFHLYGKIQDSTIAMSMAILLFILPSHKIGTEKLLTIQNILRLPWDILLLFGGGFALAHGIQESGLGDLIGKQLHFLHSLPLFLFIFLITFSVALLTEFTSNTAIATTILPILAGLAGIIQINPVLIMIPATIAASCAFMLPVSTPPNAIVFGTRMIPIQTMIKTGIVLIIFSAFITSLYFTLFFG
jgi:sodium-dependent dicarboxylate transporter 2/3/5